MLKKGSSTYQMSPLFYLKFLVFFSSFGFPLSSLPKAEVPARWFLWRDHYFYLKPGRGWGGKRPTSPPNSPRVILCRAHTRYTLVPPPRSCATGWWCWFDSWRRTDRFSWKWTAEKKKGSLIQNNQKIMSIISQNWSRSQRKYFKTHFTNSTAFIPHFLTIIWTVFKYHLRTGCWRAQSPLDFLVKTLRN